MKCPRIIHYILTLISSGWRREYRHHLWRIEAIRDTGKDPDYDWSNVLVPRLVPEYQANRARIFKEATEAPTLKDAIKRTWFA